jgi:hypothetical protein
MKCKCDNCGHVCNTSKLKVSVDLDVRLDYPLDDSRCVKPDGDCPKCGAFSYEIEPESQDVAKQEG